MNKDYKIGDLVHIPQAVELIDYQPNPQNDPQLTIPLRITTTAMPKVGVVAHIPPSGLYVRVLYDGALWTVKNENVYALGEMSRNG